MHDAVDHFNEHGWVLVPSLIPAEDIAAAQPKLFELYPAPEEVASGKRTRRTAPFLDASADGSWGAGDRMFRNGQFAGLKEAPFGDAALDNVPLHERVLDLVEAVLRTDDIRLYQAETFAKYSGGVSYEQPLHIDETNHSLVPPRRDGRYRQVQLFVYLSDVTEGRGPTRIVSRAISSSVPNNDLYFHNSGRIHLDEHESSAVGPAGSVLAYSADTAHRGVDMTEPGAGRFFFNLGFSTGGVSWTGAYPWARRGIDPRAWMDSAVERAPAGRTRISEARSPVLG